VAKLSINKILIFPNALSLSPGSKISFSEAEYAGKRKKTRREVFLVEMEQVVPWIALLKVIEPHYPVAGRGRSVI